MGLGQITPSEEHGGQTPSQHHAHTQDKILKAGQRRPKCERTFRYLVRERTEGTLEASLRVGRQRSACPGTAVPVPPPPQRAGLGLETLAPRSHQVSASLCRLLRSLRGSQPLPSLDIHSGQGPRRKNRAVHDGPHPRPAV